jgi:hypothetical protein
MRHSTATSATECDAFHAFAFHDICGIGEFCKSRMSSSDTKGWPDPRGGSRSEASFTALTTAATAATMPATAATPIRSDTPTRRLLGIVRADGEPAAGTSARGVGVLVHEGLFLMEDTCMEDQRVRGPRGMLRRWLDTATEAGLLARQRQSRWPACTWVPATTSSSNSS